MASESLSVKVGTCSETNLVTTILAAIRELEWHREKVVVKALPFPDKGAMKSNLVSKGLMTIQWKPRHTDAMVVQLRWLLKRVNQALKEGGSH